MRNRHLLWLFALIASVTLLAGCGRDPEKVKRRYLENGDKYLSQGKYKEAIIMYRNAIKKDPKFGEAYARLGDAESRRGAYPEAVGAYRRAVELIPNNEEPAGKLADIYLMAYSFKKKRDSRLIQEVTDLSKSLLQKNPSSFHGLRLQGFLEVAANQLPEAIESFKKADAAKPGQPELLFALCQVLNQTGKWPEAESRAKLILDKNPAYFPAYDFLMSEYIRRNQLADAEAVINRKVEKNPAAYGFKVQKAGFYRATQRMDQSEKVLADLLAQEGADPGVRTAVGEFYSRAREYNRAYQIFSQGVDKFPASKTPFRIRMVSTLLAEGKTKDAMDLIEATVKDDPKDDNALSMRASMILAYGEKDKTQTAVNDLQALISRTPGNAVVRYNLARAYHNRGELDAARVQYQEAIKNFNTMTAAYIGLGQVFLAKRDFGKAITTSEEVLKYDPKNVPARVIKANALTNSGNLRQARTELNAYLQDSPDAPDLKFQLAIVDFLENRFKESEAAFRALREKFPSDGRLTFAIAELMLRTNRKPEAMRFLQDELAKAPDNKEVRMAVANTALRIDQADLAEREFRKLLEADPQNADLYMRLGEVLRRKGQVQASLEMLKKGQQLAPANPTASLQLAMTLDSAGMKKESLPLYEVVVKNDPENLIALNNLAYMYAEEGRDLDLALTYAQRAKQRAPNSDDVADTLAWVYIKKNLSDNAISILKGLTSKQPKNATFHYHLGVAQSQKGDKAAARQSLQTALTLQPSRDEEAKIRELLSKVG